MIEKEVNDAVQFFAKKARQANDYESFRACVEYVGKYGLVYEVFALAMENCGAESTWQHCSSEIGYQMSEWDL